MLDSFISLGPFQWVGFLFGIIYVALAAKNNPWCWVFGAISCASIAIEDFTKTNLFSDGVLQIFYVLMAFYGIYKWKFQVKEKQLPIRQLSLIHHYIIILVGLCLSGLVSYITYNYTHAALPILDATTTVFSIIATLLLVNRYIGNWIHWIWIDLVYIYLYFDRTAPLFSILMTIYTVIAIYGLLEWLKIKKMQDQTILQQLNS